MSPSLPAHPASFWEHWAQAGRLPPARLARSAPPSLHHMDPREPQNLSLWGWGPASPALGPVLPLLGWGHRAALEPRSADNRKIPTRARQLGKPWEVLGQRPRVSGRQTSASLPSVTSLCLSHLSSEMGMMTIPPAHGCHEALTHRPIHVRGRPQPRDKRCPCEGEGGDPPHFWDVSPAARLCC